MSLTELDSGGSRISLGEYSNRDSSQDEADDNLDLSAPADDRERLSLLDAAVQWIKEELMALRQCDHNILKQLHSVHSSVRSIREQHRTAIAKESRFLDDSQDERRGSDGITNMEFSLEVPTSPLGLDSSIESLLNPVNVSAGALEATPPSQFKKETDDHILREFLGNTPMQKMNNVSAQFGGRTQEVSRDRIGGGREFGSQGRLNIPQGGGREFGSQGRLNTPQGGGREFGSQGRLNTPQGGGREFGSQGRLNSPQGQETKATRTPSPSKEKERLAALKAEAKKEGRSSMAFEMEMLRKKLHETAKEELATIRCDIEPPKLRHLELKENSNAFNRYSIFDRMDQLLQPAQTSPGRSGHSRQYSEPVDMIKYGTPPSQSPHISPSVQRSNSQHYHSPSVSRRGAPSPPSQEMRHVISTGSTNSVNSRKESTGSEDGSVHYNTSVIRGKRQKNGTLEKKKTSLKYSVESLNEEAGQYDHLGGYNQEQDLQGKRDSLPNYALQRKPMVKPKSSVPLVHSQSEYFSGVEVHPETRRGSSPFVGGVGSIQPYMTVTQLRGEMEALQTKESGKQAFVYKPYTEVMKQSSHYRPAPPPPTSSHKRSYLPSERTWL